MWNRVALLACGLGAGWSLVHWLTGAPEDVRRTRGWTLIASGLGLALVGALAVRSAAAGLFAFGALALCAGVAYAANARQVVRVEAPLRMAAPERPLAWTDTCEVLLVCAGEPGEYRGPGVWGNLLKQRAVRGQPSPHWLAVPVALARVREAVGRQDQEDSLRCWCSRLAGALATDLGEKYRVREAFLWGEPVLETAAREAVARGTRVLVVVPLGLGRDRVPLLRESTSRARIAEAGTTVTYIEQPDALAWLETYQDERLSALLRGQVPRPPRAIDRSLITGLANAVRGTEETETLSP